MHAYLLLLCRWAGMNGVRLSFCIFQIFYRSLETVNNNLLLRVCFFIFFLFYSFSYGILVFVQSNRIWMEKNHSSFKTKRKAIHILALFFYHMCAAASLSPQSAYYRICERETTCRVRWMNSKPAIAWMVHHMYYGIQESYIHMYIHPSIHPTIHGSHSTIHSTNDADLIMQSHATNSNWC